MQELLIAYTQFKCGKQIIFINNMQIKWNSSTPYIFVFFKRDIEINQVEICTKIKNYKVCSKLIQSWRVIWKIFETPRQVIKKRWCNICEDVASEKALFSESRISIKLKTSLYLILGLYANILRASKVLKLLSCYHNLNNMYKRCEYIIKNRLTIIT